MNKFTLGLKITLFLLFCVILMGFNAVLLLDEDVQDLSGLFERLVKMNAQLLAQK